MHITDIARQKELTTARGTHISYGLDASGLKEPTISDHLTFVYAPAAGLLHVRNEEILIEPKSVTVIKPGIEVKLEAAEQDFPYIVYRVPAKKPTLTTEQAAKLEREYVLDRSEWNSSIDELLDGDVIQYTDNSRIIIPLLKKGKRVKSGWYTQAFKDQPFSISDAEWERVREAEIMHYHQVLEEVYIVFDGTAYMHVDGDVREVPKGSISISELGETHGIKDVVVGQSGMYRHLCTQYPSITMDKGERINVDTKEGFDMSGLKK